MAKGEQEDFKLSQSATVMTGCWNGIKIKGWPAPIKE